MLTLKARVPEISGLHSAKKKPNRLSVITPKDHVAMKTAPHVLEKEWIKLLNGTNMNHIRLVPSYQPRLKFREADLVVG